jgi:tRNA pseudouridine13 synthase
VSRDGGNLLAILREAERIAARSDTRQQGGSPHGGRGRGGRGGDDDRGFMLSAARSLIFNAILAERVRRATWNQIAAGDVANLDGRGSVFNVAQPDGDIAARCAELDIHPTAPLLGEGESMAQGEMRDLEDSIAAQFPEALAVIRAARMNSERRALRIRIRDLDYEYSDAVLRIRFALSSGSFATTVLREIITGVASGE